MSASLLLFIKTPEEEVLSETEGSGEKEREVGVSRFAFTVLVSCKEKNLKLEVKE